MQVSSIYASCAMRIRFGSTCDHRRCDLLSALLTLVVVEFGQLAFCVWNERATK